MCREDEGGCKRSGRDEHGSRDAGSADGKGHVGSSIGARATVLEPVSR
jgi:hypothetical protein